MPDFVTLFEMSPRDGLQNEKTLVATADKIKLIDLLSACGFKKIEATSFVSPKWVPQMGDAAEVMAGINRKPGVRYTVLTPNMKGYEGAHAAKADEVAIFGSASEGFSQKNINCSIAESLERFRPVLAAAKADGIPVRGYVSCITDCPYDGPTPPQKAAEVVQAMLEMGCYEIGLSDTIGAATPDSTAKMLEAVLEIARPSHLAGHFHDTRGRALDNIEVCLSSGLRTFDGAAAGLGGCPYAPGAKGNVDTVGIVGLLDRLGYAHGIDRDRLNDAATFARTLRTPA